MSTLNNESLQKRAEQARGKKAVYGDDVDVAAYTAQPADHAYVQDLKTVPEKAELLAAGVDVTETGRSGTYVQMDHSVVHCQALDPNIELLPIDDARAQYPWLKDYWWHAVAPDADKYTAQAALEPHYGYFIRAKKGVKSVFPLQACLFIGQEGASQNVHNIIVVEEGAELHVITGCTTAKHVRSGLHVGVSEFYVQKNAKISFTMIHNWAEEVMVRPRTGTIVEAGGVFISNYVCMRPVKSLQMYPVTKLVGKGATARYNTILVATPGSSMDVGSKVVLAAEDTRAEIIARTMTTGGTVIARGQLVAEVPRVKAHLECRGLILSDKGMLHAIPELMAHASNVDLSHEAAVGKIAQEEIEYLMARGLSKDEATATIVRGFLNVTIEGLPEIVKSEIDALLSQLDTEAL